MVRGDKDPFGLNDKSVFGQVKVFGDYYHFRHHAVEKRALSGHKGIHIRLQKEPQQVPVCAARKQRRKILQGPEMQQTSPAHKTPPTQTDSGPYAVPALFLCSYKYGNNSFL
ncbi:hypothetical protein AMECASPLE_012529 [Ameca splendens]|uniref:Peptidase S8 pro-domain domain-containing protein n=1 Tax=Ameca splendens TaxID=208324 RepID=A0ABV0ZMM7_9TELE